MKNKYKPNARNKWKGQRKEECEKVSFDYTVSYCFCTKNSYNFSISLFKQKIVKQIFRSKQCSIIKLICNQSVNQLRNFSKQNKITMPNFTSNLGVYRKSIFLSVFNLKNDKISQRCYLTLKWKILIEFSRRRAAVLEDDETLDDCLSIMEWTQKSYPI